MIGQRRRLYTVCISLHAMRACRLDVWTDTGRTVANTISRLFNAQRQHPHAEPLPSQATTMARTDQTQRSTLHAFWTIPKPVPAVVIDTPMVFDQPASSALNSCPRCEDCEDPLRSEHAMDLDDESMTQETACIACKRCVCDRCAVLGNVRICLGCASGHER